MNTPVISMHGWRGRKFFRANIHRYIQGAAWLQPSFVGGKRG